MLAGMYQRIIFRKKNQKIIRFLSIQTESKTMVFMDIPARIIFEVKPVVLQFLHVGPSGFPNCGKNRFYL